MTKVIDIPRTMATKVHSGPSILDLPNEVRTLISGFLFEHDEKIRINYREDRELVIDTRFHYDNKSRMAPTVVESDAYLSVKKGINFLLSCCQVYHEAASVLYSNNTFVFGKSADNHVERIGQVAIAAQ
jgi:hypothetical protein